MLIIICFVAMTVIGVALLYNSRSDFIGFVGILLIAIGAILSLLLIISAVCVHVTIKYDRICMQTEYDYLISEIAYSEDEVLYGRIVAWNKSLKVAKNIRSSIWVGCLVSPVVDEFELIELPDRYD